MYKTLLYSNCCLSGKFIYLKSTFTFQTNGLRRYRCRVVGWQDVRESVAVNATLEVKRH